MSKSTNFPLLKFLCFALVLQQTLGVGVPLAELFASCAFFAGDVYNETPLSVPSPLPGWKHASAYRFHLVETGYHDGYADGYTSDQGDYVLAVRGSYAVNPDYSYVKEKAGGLIPNPLSDSLDPHNLVQGMVWHKALRYAEAENMLQKPLDRKTLLTDAVLMCRRGLRVAITGHGYGGGIATFLAWKLHAEEPDCEVKVVTFGAPPIATEKAVKSFFDQLNLDMKRFVMQCFDGNKGTAWWDASIHSDPTATSTDPHVLVDFGPEASLQGRFQPLWKRAQRLATDTKHDQNEVAVRTCHEMSNYFDALQQELKAERGYALKWCAASVKEQAEIDGDDIVHVKPEGDADLLPPSLKKFIPLRALNEVSDFDEDDSRESKRTHATCLHTPSFDRDAEKPTRLKRANRKRK